MTRGFAILIVVACARAAAAQPPPEAERLYTEGQQAYDAKKFDVALAKWERSYELSKIPALVFNIAQAARLGGNCTKAVASYKQFIELEPTSTERPDAEGFIKDLEPTCPDKPPVKPPVKPIKPLGNGGVVDKPPIDPHPGRTKKRIGFAAIGTGVALAATGLYFGGKAKSIGSEIEDDCADADGCNWDDLRDKDAAGRRDETLQYVLLGAGGAVALTGVVVYMLGARASSSSVAVTPRAEGGATVTWAGRF